MYPRSDIRAGITRSGSDGTFSFVLSHPPHRLSFTALGARKQRLVKPYTHEVSLGDVTVRHPSPDRPTVITIPDDFKPTNR
jgi:hypothetical protein